MAMNAEMATPTVLLVQAYRWTCDCGAVNFEEPVAQDMHIQEKREVIASAEGITPDELHLTDEELDQFIVTNAPTQVQCANCLSSFSAETFTGLGLKDFKGGK